MFLPGWDLGKERTATAPGRSVVLWEADSDEDWEAGHIIAVRAVVAWDQPTSSWCAEIDPLTVARLDGSQTPEGAARRGNLNVSALQAEVSFRGDDRAEVRFASAGDIRVAPGPVTVAKLDGWWYRTSDGPVTTGPSPAFVSRGRAVAHLVFSGISVSWLTLLLLPGGTVQGSDDGAVSFILLLTWLLVGWYVLVVAWDMRDEWEVGAVGWFLFGWPVAQVISLVRLLSPWMYMEAAARLGWSRRTRLVVLSAVAACFAGLVVVPHILAG